MGKRVKEAAGEATKTKAYLEKHFQVPSELAELLRLGRVDDPTSTAQLAETAANGHTGTRRPSRAAGTAATNGRQASAR